VVVELTVETFRPLFEGHIQPFYGDGLFGRHHGQWQQKYRDALPTLHDPAARRWMAVTEMDSAVAGLIAWNIAERPNHARIYPLAVSEPYRCVRVGRRLCLHAIEAAGGRGEVV
jgi:ribosomal protein S18 acetylase RimI-like enzyme